MENNEDEDNSQKSIYYNYAFMDYLIKDMNMLVDINKYSQINLCIYTVNTTGKYPFLQYLLSANCFKTLGLPVLPVFRSFNNEMLVSYSSVFLSGILQIEDFENFDKKLEFKGFYEFEGCLENDDVYLYLFFDATNCKLDIDETYSSNLTRFALTDEIMNKRNICNIPINKETTNFFIHNDQINYLYDENNIAYQTPVVGFVGKPTPEKLKFVYTFGESAKNKSAILGPHFYFSDFNYAIRQGGWSHNYKPEHIYDKLITDNGNGRYLKGGIVRFALFIGKIKIIENTPTDPNDESDIKKDRLKDTTLNQNYEIQTLRISDHDGLWVRKYDSVYLGNLELDDGSFIEEGPIITLKDYNQQIPLSYHFIDKNNLGNKYDYNNHSYRIV